jgi:3alpha(or 20beta)-hydroxysteroid dehydrogenase
MCELDGKVALITGAARGQGASHARRLARAGAQVVITDVLEREGRALADEIGDVASFVRHDVSSEAAWEAVVDFIRKKHGRLDIVVNNAGIWRPLSIADTTLSVFDELVRINQIGTFLGIKLVVDLMRESGGGSIVNISSMAAIRDLADSFAYSATKWAVRGMTKVAALELAQHRIRVNSIHPGAINTPMLKENSEEVNRSLPDIPPLKRLGEPDEIAELVLFLASESSNYITGAEVVIDGGWTA